MTYREFVAAYLRQHRPRSPAEARLKLRQAARAWRAQHGRGNPHDEWSPLKAGFAGGLGLAAGLVAAAAALCLISKPRGTFE